MARNLEKLGKKTPNSKFRAKKRKEKDIREAEPLILHLVVYNRWQDVLSQELFSLLLYYLSLVVVVDCC